MFREADSILVAVVLLLTVAALAFGGPLIDEPPFALSSDISPLDPRLFPTVVLVGLAAVCGLFLINRARELEQAGSHPIAAASAADVAGGLKRQLSFLVVIVVCALLLEHAGFLITMFLLMAATSLLVGNDSLPQILSISAILPLSLYVLVTHFLRTSLPELDAIETALAPLLNLLPGL